MIITIFDCCSSKVLTFCSLEHMDVNAATNSCYSNFSKVWWKQLLKELLENGFLWPKAVSLCLFMHGLAAPLWISYLSVQVLMQPWTLLFVSFCTSCWANSQSSSQLTHPLTWALIWGPLRTPKVPSQSGGQGPLSILPLPQWLHSLHNANNTMATVKTHHLDTNLHAHLSIFAKQTHWK